MQELKMWGCADVSSSRRMALSRSGFSLSQESMCPGKKQSHFLFAKEEFGKTQLLLFHSCIIPTELIADNHTVARNKYKYMPICAHI